MLQPVTYPKDDSDDDSSNDSGQSKGKKKNGNGNENGNVNENKTKKEKETEKKQNENETNGPDERYVAFMEALDVVYWPGVGFVHVNCDGSGYACDGCEECC